MKTKTLTFLLTALIFYIGQFSFATEEKYIADFEAVDPGEVPDDFLILEGEFAVREVEGNNLLELAPFPLSTFTLLLGSAETEDVTIQARMKGDLQKRRFPVFGVGLSGISGYRLQVNPARKELELYRQEVVQATSDFSWKPDKWTVLLLQVLKTPEGKWKVQGKAWVEGSMRPADWMVSYDESEEPLSGRPSLWGTPYAGKPIWFDDAVITSNPVE